MYVSHTWVIQDTNLTLFILFSNICTKKGGSEHPGTCRGAMHNPKQAFQALAENCAK